MSAPDRRALLCPAHGKLSIRRQCALLGLGTMSGFDPYRSISLRPKLADQCRVRAL